MANFFKNNGNAQNLSERDLLLNKYHTGRHNLLLVVLFTAINIVLLVTNSDSYFLFSAFIPYFIAMIGMDVCGMLPSEYYESLGEDYSELVFSDKGVFGVILAIAVIFVGLYLVSWFLAKKPRVGWMIFALVFFVIDTLGMFAIMGFGVESIIDIVFHAWVIISLASGIISYYKLKKLPEEVPETTVENSEPTAMLNGEAVEDSKLN